MNEKLKVLVLVMEPWRNDDGGGNTLNNFFEGMDLEFAQIYNSTLPPQNNICDKYFRITEPEVVKNFFSHKSVGHEFFYNKTQLEKCEEIKTDKVLSKSKIFKVFRLNIFIFAKMFLWKTCNYKSNELEAFVKDFNPDVIYAPCYASPFQLEFTRYIKELTGKKILSWSADDNYSLKQFSLSPFFWINRLWVRSCLRKTYPYYDDFYSISEEEIEELSPVVGKTMKILRKGVNIDLLKEHDKVNFPIKLVYAGGIYIQRWKTLAEIGKALKEINKDETKMVLDIYTQNTLTEKQKEALNDGKNIFVHKAVSTDELNKIYSKSDIAIHCESFSLKNRLTTRLSFSTKIVDCLSSGCAVLAIAWKEHTGIKYLKKYDAAFCVESLKEIMPCLEKISKNPDIVSVYSRKALDCCIKNHNMKEIQKDLYASFKNLVEK